MSSLNCVVSNILLPHPRLFFLMALFTDFFYNFQRKKITIRSGAKDMLLKQNYLLHSQNSSSMPSLSPLKQTLLFIVVFKVR